MKKRREMDAFCYDENEEVAVQTLTTTRSSLVFLFDTFLFDVLDNDNRCNNECGCINNVIGVQRIVAHERSSRYTK